MKIDDLVRDENFRKKVQSAQSLNEVAEILSVNGIELSVEDIEAAFAQTVSDELDESSLEYVAGGALGTFRYILPLLPLIPMPIIPRKYRR